MASEQDKEAALRGELRGQGKWWGKGRRKGVEVFRTLAIIIHLPSTIPKNSASWSRFFPIIV